VRACLRRPVDRTPVWFLRQAGRYMQEYRDVRKHHTLVEICKQPEIAAEVTITAAEKLGVDAAIIFADLLLPLEPMGLPFEFQAGEGRWSTIPSAPPRMCARCAPIAPTIWPMWRARFRKWPRTSATGWASSASAARRSRWPAT
jgi:hypothetical protein